MNVAPRKSRSERKGLPTKVLQEHKTRSINKVLVILFKIAFDKEDSTCYALQPNLTMFCEQYGYTRF